MLHAPRARSSQDTQSFDIEAFGIEGWYGDTMPRPPRTPIGLRLSRTARIVGRAFDDALSAAGGSLPMWLILISLKSQEPANQRQLAEAVGIQEATLSHHLNAMVEQGLVVRERDPDNRRVHQVQLTDDGDAAFARMRRAAAGFDQRLRLGLSEDDIATFEVVLERLAQNVNAESRSRA
jgi:MarR family transcriptional regulator, transcriptional regulator for hemolysin